jgi:hypothetical protein
MGKVYGTISFHFYLQVSSNSFVSALMETPDIAVGTVTSYRLDNRRVEFESQQGQEFSLLHVIQTSSEAHPVSFPTGTGDSFPGSKVAGE